MIAPPTAPPVIRRLLALLCLILAVTDADLPALLAWAVTTRPILWEPLALATVGTLWFDRLERSARKENR